MRECSLRTGTISSPTLHRWRARSQLDLQHRYRKDRVAHIGSWWSIWSARALLSGEGVALRRRIWGCAQCVDGGSVRACLLNCGLLCWPLLEVVEVLDNYIPWSPLSIMVMEIQRCTARISFYIMLSYVCGVSSQEYLALFRNSERWDSWLLSMARLHYDSQFFVLRNIVTHNNILRNLVVLWIRRSRRVSQSCRCW